MRGCPFWQILDRETASPTVCGAHFALALSLQSNHFLRCVLFTLLDKIRTGICDLVGCSGYSRTCVRAPPHLARKQAWAPGACQEARSALALLPACDSTWIVARLVVLRGLPSTICVFGLAPYRVIHEGFNAYLGPVWGTPPICVGRRPTSMHACTPNTPVVVSPASGRVHASACTPTPCMHASPAGLAA